MPEVRKDSKGRRLWTGESQQLYHSKWWNHYGIGISEKLHLTKKRSTPQYQNNYNFVINIIAKEEFGKKRIDKVKLSDVNNG